MATDEGGERSAESRFRVAGLVAQAAKRFARSINPPVSFGKPLSNASSSPRGAEEDAQDHGKSKSARKHTADILFAPLSPVDSNKK